MSLIKSENFDRLLYWIRERFYIYQRRMLGEKKPWTDDPILRNNFFTMPYRELDKTTLWFRTNVRQPLWDDPRVLFATICFRWFNYIPTGEVLLGKNSTIFKAPTGGAAHGTANGIHFQNLLHHWNPTEAKRRLLGRQPIFTGAFNISNSGSTKPKLDRVIDDYINPVWSRREDILVSLGALPGRSSTRWPGDGPCTLQYAHSILRNLPGLGGSGFMAYEVICDLRHTYLLENASDIETWTNMGPGAKRGLNRLLGNDPKTPLPKYWPALMKELLAAINADLLASVPRAGPKRVVRSGPIDHTVPWHNAHEMTDPARSGFLPRFEMREVEHSLCEFDKYERVRLGQGKSKRSFNGR